MRTFVKISLPAAAGNRGMKDGTVPRLIARFTEAARPEAAYFGVFGGKRTMIAVFDQAQSSDMPRLLEPFFLELEAEIELAPIMNAEELQAGLSQVG